LSFTPALGRDQYRPVGRQSLYRLTQPALLGLLTAAEQLLADTGNAVDLCPAWGSADASSTAATA